MIEIQIEGFTMMLVFIGLAWGALIPVTIMVGYLNDEKKKAERRAE